MNERQRIEKIISNENMTAKQFATEVGIQAGTISNILSGRNNPSLDVMQKILNRFRTLNSDWLILGVGSMYRVNGDGPQQTLFDVRPEDSDDQDTLPIVETQKKEQHTAAPSIILSGKSAGSSVMRSTSKTIDRVVIFYSDGTFEER